MSVITDINFDNHNLPYQANYGQDRPFGCGLMGSGVLVIAVFLFGLGVWSFFAPIESAVISQGIIHVDSSRKTIQHLSGGIVQEILVREGDRVKSGDTLIRLEDTQQRSMRNQLKARYFEALAAVARLKSERAELLTINFPLELTAQNNNDDASIAIEGQNDLFLSRKQLRDEQLLAYDQRLMGLQTEIIAINDQLKAGEKQKSIAQDLIALNEEKNQKYNKGRVLELEMDKARIESEISNTQISLARANQSILESILQRIEIEVTEKKQIEEELRTFSALVYDLQQQLAVAEDKLERTEIKTYTDGEVVGLTVHTVGGVINAGQGLLDIVPSGDELIVETAIDLKDIDQVKEGTAALIELTSLNHRFQKPIEGKVKWVSADTLIDPSTGRGFYKARIELDKESLKQQDVVLQPGMGAEVMIRTGARSPLEYLMTPISRSFGHALREQ
jgi:HlyD family type I secretion membrane fusion protein